MKLSCWVIKRTLTSTGNPNLSWHVLFTGYNFLASKKWKHATKLKHRQIPEIPAGFSNIYMLQFFLHILHNNHWITFQENLTKMMLIFLIRSYFEGYSFFANSKFHFFAKLLDKSSRVSSFIFDAKWSLHLLQMKKKQEARFVLREVPRRRGLKVESIG